MNGLAAVLNESDQANNTQQPQEGLQLALTVERAVLLKSLSHVQSVVEKRNTIAVLSNILLEAEGGNIKLTATDMDISITDNLPADISQEGAITVSAHLLYDIVRKLPDGAQVELRAEGSKIQINAGKSKFSLPTLAASEFPKIDSGELSHHFTLVPEELVALIEKTRFAISQEETRYYLNGIYFHISDDGNEPVISAVATDGHKLAKIDVTAPAEAKTMPGVIIPRKTVQELKKLLENAEEEVQISLSDKKIKFSCGPTTLISKLIDGTYPDYQKVIPANNQQVLKVNTSELTRTIDRVAVVSSEKTHAIRFALSDNKITVSATNEESSEAIEELACEYQGQAISAGYNARYMLDMLGSIEGKELTFSYASGDDPIIIRDSEGPSAVYVIMPLHL